MDRLEAMGILIAAVEAGSLSAASRRLGTPLATVSRKVSELENHLKARLLNRSSRRLTLTDAGQSYVAACRRIIEEVGEAERAASGEYQAPKGELAITAPIVMGRLHVVPVVTEFLAAFPDIDVRLLLVDRMVDFQEESIDLAIRIAELSDSSLVAVRVGEIRRVVCGSPDYFARHGTPKAPAELKSHAAIAFEGLRPSGGWAFAAGKSPVTVPIRARLVVNTAEAAIDAAIAGLGIARVLSYQAAEAIRRGALVAILKEFELAPWPVNLIYAGGRRLPLKLRAFLDFAAPRLKARLAASAL